MVNNLRYNGADANDLLRFNMKAPREEEEVMDIPQWQDIIRWYCVSCYYTLVLCSWVVTVIELKMWSRGLKLVEMTLISLYSCVTTLVEKLLFSTSYVLLFELRAVHILTVVRTVSLELCPSKWMRIDSWTLHHRQKRRQDGLLSEEDPIG